MYMNLYMYVEAIDISVAGCHPSLWTLADLDILMTKINLKRIDGDKVK